MSRIYQCITIICLSLFVGLIAPTQGNAQVLPNNGGHSCGYYPPQTYCQCVSYIDNQLFRAPEEYCALASPSPIPPGCPCNSNADCEGLVDSHGRPALCILTQGGSEDPLGFRGSCGTITIVSAPGYGGPGKGGAKCLADCINIYELEFGIEPGQVYIPENPPEYVTNCMRRCNVGGLDPRRFEYIYEWVNGPSCRTNPGNPPGGA